MRGRSARDVLGPSFSASDEETDDCRLKSASVCECKVGLGIGGVVRATGSDASDSMAGTLGAGVLCVLMRKTTKLREEYNGRGGKKIAVSLW